MIHNKNLCIVVRSKKYKDDRSKEIKYLFYLKRTRSVMRLATSLVFSFPYE